MLLPLEYSGEIAYLKPAVTVNFVSNSRTIKPQSQILILRAGDLIELYSCISNRICDAADSPYVVRTGVDLSPALRAQGAGPDDTIRPIKDSSNDSRFNVLFVYK